ncbi:MAG TPA: hypothetical protein P5081_10765 [Phycisphaerae bacterium]|nr:hypothetical protein [Phycisphaerae bacterium]HRW53360.1 hypothetical protein [Phycisphaerae bacterium]
MKRRLMIQTVSLAALAITTIASAQPTYINLGRVTSGDISADGDAVVGSLLDSSIGEGLVSVWRRGQGVEFLPDGFAEGPIFASTDLSALAMSKDNIDDWGDLNCFLGNEAAPQMEPCSLRNIAHRWSMGTGWLNCESFPRSQVTMDYACNGAPLAPVDVWIGGTRCDFTINSPNDISGDGRYVVGGGYVANADPRTNGCAPTGICGRFRAFRYDATTQAFDMLPFEASSTASRADRVNGDGSVIVGYDQGASPDPDGIGPLVGYTGRRLTVWRDGVESILDLYGSQDGAPTTADGTQVAAKISNQLAQIELALSADVRIARWTWNGATWSISEIGRTDNYVEDGVQMTLADMYATAISDDGDTIVGASVYYPGSPPWSPSQRQLRAFIWRPTINAGQPILLADYIASQLPMGDTSFDNIRMYSANKLSADGNSIVLDIADDSSPCLTTFADALVDLDGATCEPPRLNLPLVSHVQENYSSLGGVINCFVSGTGPLHYQWQRKDLATATWVDLVDDDCENFASFMIKGSNASQLRIGLFNCDEGTGDYRCVVTNPCGSVTTNAAHFTVGPNAPQFFCFLPGDMNNDIVVNVDDIPNFVASILCKPFPDTFSPADRADVNFDGVKDGRDVQAFVQLLVP